MKLDELFSPSNESKNIQILFSICSTRSIEFKVRIKGKCNNLACDLGSFQSSILVGLSDRFAALTHDLLGLKEKTVIPVQGFNVDGCCLVPNVDFEIIKDGFHLDDSSIKLLTDTIERFFMMTVSNFHKGHQCELLNTFTEEQLVVLEKNADEFLSNFERRNISTPIKIIGLGQEKILSGKFLPKKITEDISSDPYFIQAYFNGYILDQHELHLMKDDGAKLVVYFDIDQQFNDVHNLGDSRHELTIFKVRNLAGKKRGKTINLVNIEGLVDPLAKKPSIPDA